MRRRRCLRRGARSVKNDVSRNLAKELGGMHLFNTAEVLAAGYALRDREGEGRHGCGSSVRGGDDPYQGGCRTGRGEGQRAVLEDGCILEDLEPRLGGAGLRRVGSRRSFRHHDVQVLHRHVNCQTYYEGSEWTHTPGW